jgi:hypothetical protein
LKAYTGYNTSIHRTCGFLKINFNYNIKEKKNGGFSFRFRDRIHEIPTIDEQLLPEKKWKRKPYQTSASQREKLSILSTKTRTNSSKD